MTDCLHPAGCVAPLNVTGGTPQSVIPRERTTCNQRPHNRLRATEESTFRCLVACRDAPDWPHPAVAPPHVRFIQAGTRRRSDLLDQRKVVGPAVVARFGAGDEAAVAKELVAKDRKMQARITATRTQKVWLAKMDESQLRCFCAIV